MRTCKECKWYSFCRKWYSFFRGMGYPERIEPCDCFERKTMVESKTLQEAYKVMQAAWVELYDVEVGDTVKIIRNMKHNELGSLHDYCDWMTGKECRVSAIKDNYIALEQAGYFPFFCLEVVKKAEPKIEVTCKINGKAMPLSTLSEETILNIRRSSK